MRLALISALYVASTWSVAFTLAAIGRCVSKRYRPPCKLAIVAWLWLTSAIGGIVGAAIVLSAIGADVDVAHDIAKLIMD